MPRPRRRREDRGFGWRPGLARIRANRTEGAGPLARDALAILDQTLRRARRASGAEWRAWASEVAHALAATQPAMALFAQWAGDWRSMVRSARGAPLRPRLRAWVRRWKRRLREEPRRIDRVVVRRLPPRARVVTISHSSTVVGAFRSMPAARRPREVIALESRPGGEGRTLARALRGVGVPARWVRDPSMPRVVRTADVVVLGADTVESNGDVVHKVGTRALAEEAGRAEVPVVVVAGRSKWRLASTPRSPLPPRFDRTPARWISEYWTDRGVSRSRGRRHGAPLSQRR